VDRQQAWGGGREDGTGREVVGVQNKTRGRERSRRRGERRGEASRRAVGRDDREAVRGGARPVGDRPPLDRSVGGFDRDGELD
jgi:hypothetical protein